MKNLKHFSSGELSHIRNNWRRQRAMHLFIFIGTMMLFLPLIAAAQSGEDEAIKTAIKNAMNASMSKNGDSWQKMWVHDSKASQTWIFNSGYNRFKGWENFGPQTIDYFKKNPKPDAIETSLDSFMIRTSGNMAWVEYNSTGKLTEYGENITRTAHQFRLLVKENNQWKIASAISHSTTDQSLTAHALENNLNDLGYKYLNAKKINEAIELFKLNIKLYPSAWNPYDSLGEAYALAGNKDLAIQNYQKSIELNPKNENGINALKKLKAQ